MVWKAEIKLCLPDHSPIEFDIKLPAAAKLKQKFICHRHFDSLKHTFSLICISWSTFLFRKLIIPTISSSAFGEINYCKQHAVT